MWSEDLRSTDFNYMIRMEIGHESNIVEKRLKVYVIGDKTPAVVVASYCSVSRNPVRFKALI